MRHGLVVALLYGTAAAPCDPRNRSAGAAAPTPRWLAVYYHKTGHDFSKALFGALSELFGVGSVAEDPFEPLRARARAPRAAEYLSLIHI